MKKIIILVCFFIGVNCFSQTNSIQSNDKYPIISIDSTNKKTVIFTMEQAREINTKLDILKLMNKSSNLSMNLDSVYVQVIDNKNKIIASQDIKIKKLEELSDNKDKEIKNLKNQITNYKLSQKTYIREIKNKDKEINLHLDRIDKLEKKTLWGGILGGLVITVLTFITITN